MAVENGGKSIKFIDAVDKELHDNIIRLTQKLKGLQAEVEAKLESIEKTDVNAAKITEVFTLAAGEISQILDYIKATTNMILHDGVTKQEFLQENQENIENLRDFCSTTLDKISKLQELL